MKPLTKTAALAAVALTFTVSAVCTYAADSSARTYADPACSARDANPEKCVINDGPAVRTGTERRDIGPIAPGPSPGPVPPVTNVPRPTPTLQRGWK